MLPAREEGRPPEWSELWRFEIGSNVAAAITLVGVALGFIAALAFGALLLRLHPVAPFNPPFNPVVIPLALVAGITAHEAVRALVFMAYEEGLA